MEKSRDYFIAQAQDFLANTRDYDKSAAAKFHGYMQLAESAAYYESAQPKRSNRIRYASEEEGRGWNAHLMGRQYVKRDMGTSSGAGIGGVSPLMPLGFYNSVTHGRKLTDQLFDPNISTIIRTATGAPIALPTDLDVNAASVMLSEGAQSAAQDPVMGMVALGSAPNWRTSFYASVEWLTDIGSPGGIDWDVFLATVLGVRFARGFGQSLVSTLLSGAAQTVTVAGAGASGQTMAGQTAAGASIGSDDCIALMQSLDGAYIQRSSWCMAPKTYLSLMGLRGSTGNLVFTPERDEQGRPLLFSRPVIFSPSMPDIGSATRSIALGDFSRLVIREGSMTLQASSERRPETGSIYYWSTWRLQSTLAIDPNVASQDKPFVTFVGTREAETKSSEPAKPEGGTHHGKTRN